MLRVRETVHIATKDGVRTVTPEDLIEDGDELAKGRESLFEKVTDSGETKPARQRRTPAKSAAKKDD